MHKIASELKPELGRESSATAKRLAASGLSLAKGELNSRLEELRNAVQSEAIQLSDTVAELQANVI
jgi:hypothetical protein